MKNPSRRLLSTFACVVRIALAGTVLLALLGGGCPDGVGGEPGPTGIKFASASGDFTRTTFVFGEEFELPVAITPLPGETPGTRVPVQSSHILETSGFENRSAHSQSMTLPQPGSWAYTTFRLRAATHPPSRPFAPELEASRYNAVEGAASQRVFREVKLVPGLAKVTLTPPSSQIVRSGSQTFLLSILPVANTSGPQTLHLTTDAPSLTVTPSTLTVDLVPGSTTSVERTVVVRAAADAGLGDHNLFVEQTYSGIDPVFLAFAPIEVGLGTNPPDFTIKATPASLAVANGVPSAPVTFELKSVNGFDADVTITHSSPDDYDVTPDPTPHTVRVRPGSPVTFTRQLTRFFHTTPVLVRFRANTPTANPKEVVITLNYASGTPDFTFSANPTTVAIGTYVLSNDVTFTLRSLSGYAGQINVSNEPDGPLGEEPATGDFLVTLAAGETKTFTRKFIRYTGTATHHFYYTARDTVTSVSKNVDVTITP